MITLDSPYKQSMEKENVLNSQLWHACAGGMVQMPPKHSNVFYFPQGHAEHCNDNVDFGRLTRIPSHILCRVSEIKFLADRETDEVYAKIRLAPLRNGNEFPFSGGSGGAVLGEIQDKPTSFAKTLTQSDANNGGGFSVPRYCAETIFPSLDYAADPPVQNIYARDVHGEVWKFRHIYRGTPRRHLLTTGWSTFVNQKKLVAGDSIVFLKSEKELHVGIRRAKRGFGPRPDSPSSGWNPASWISPFGGFSAFVKEDNRKLTRNGGSLNCVGGKGKVKPESVTEAATLAAGGEPFEVVYYPRASTPEFCVKEEVVRAAMRIQWCSGMRFKMAFETEDSSRISWFMGTISSVQVSDPVRWPNSPWRLLQVIWDEPDLLQNVKCISPWLVELVSSMPTIHLSPFSPPRKKLRLPHQLEFPLETQFPTPTFSGNLLGPNSPLSCSLDDAPAGIQGARHPQFGISLSDLHLNKLQAGLFPPTSFQQVDYTPQSSILSNALSSAHSFQENVSCLLTIGTSPTVEKKSENESPRQLMLFGRPLLTEQQMSLSCSGGSVSADIIRNSSSDSSPDKPANNNALTENSLGPGFSWYKECQASELGLETGHCKVFMESEDVGRTLDLSVLGSYEELYRRLASMFGIERYEMLSHVLYRDASGAVKYTGDEPFSDFMRTARKLTILTDSGSDNIGR